MQSPRTVWLIATAPLIAVMLMIFLSFPSEVDAQSPEGVEGVSSFALMELPTCRVAGGQCGLYNQDFKVAFSITPAGQLRLRSSQPLDYVLVGLASSGNQQPDVASPVDAETRDRWVFEFGGMPDVEDRLRIVAVIGESTWFGEASLIFLRAGD